MKYLVIKMFGSFDSCIFWGRCGIIQIIGVGVCGHTLKGSRVSALLFFINR